MIASLDELANRLANADMGPKQRSLYIHGEVGGGKTMLMDLFFESVVIEAKHRTHFHLFMAELHDRLHDARQQIARGRVDGDDRVALVVHSLARETRLLCFDEIAVTDIADATMLDRVFADLFSLGVIFVVTSNVEPERIYEGGVNCHRILPFVRLLCERLDLMALEVQADFRLQTPRGKHVWHVPADAAASAELDRIFYRLTDGAAPRVRVFRMQGYALRVQHQERGVARFSFRELCDGPLWTSDYLVIAQNFHTLIVDGIPARFLHRNHARRFCALIDILYEHRVKLIASADTELDDIQAGMASVLAPATGPAVRPSDTTLEMLEFKRAASRLAEMCSSGNRLNAR